MKYEKDDVDKRIEENDLKTNRTLQHLRDINFYKFNIGDVLVREDKYGDQWKVKTAACGLPYKYVYVFENELGVGYIRRLSVNGRKYVDTAVCVVHYDPLKTRFHLDPSFANHILLADEDDQFDIKSEYADAKKRREAMHRKNLKMAEKIECVTDAISFMKRLKIGDTLWWGWSIRSIKRDPITVVAINLKTGIDADSSTIEYAGHPFRNNFINVAQLINQKIFTQRPLFQDELL